PTGLDGSGPRRADQHERVDATKADDGGESLRRCGRLAGHARREGATIVPRSMTAGAGSFRPKSNGPMSVPAGVARGIPRRRRSIMEKFMFIFRGGGIVVQPPPPPAEIGAHLAKWTAWVDGLAKAGHTESHLPPLQNGGKTVR